MIDRIIDAIRFDSIVARGDYAHFANDQYKPYLLSKKKFYQIEDSLYDKRLVFIDGGNAEIISTPSISLHSIRVAYTIFSSNKKIGANKFDFYCLTTTDGKEDKISYKTQFFSTNKAVTPFEEDLYFNSFDQTIKEGNKRARISKVGEVARRFAELKLAASMADELKEDDAIILDGTLECDYTNEHKYLNALYEKATKRGVLVCALAKTTSLLTDKGDSLATLLSELGPDSSWLYHPIADIECPSHQAEMFFVKLHKRSKHVFRFEVFKKQKEKDIHQVIGLLAQNSRDLSFPGYPYGLILADKLARITHNEQNFLKTTFLAKSDKRLENLRKHANATNAHDILNKI